MGEESKRGYGLLIGLLAVLGLALAGQSFFMWWMAPEQADPSELPPGDQRVLNVKVDDRRWIASDKDDDGTVDCLMPVGSAMLTGLDVFYADGWEGRCSRLDLGQRPLPAAIRDAASTLANGKWVARISHGTVIDVDGDGVADCVENIHVPDAIAEYWPGAGCPAETGRRIDQVRRGILTRMMELEAEVVTFVRQATAD